MKNFDKLFSEFDSLMNDIAKNRKVYTVDLGDLKKYSGTLGEFLKEIKEDVKQAATDIKEKTVGASMYDEVNNSIKELEEAKEILVKHKCGTKEVLDVINRRIALLQSV